MTNLIVFPAQTGSSVGDSKKYMVAMQSVITIEVEVDAIDVATAKSTAIEQFRNNGIMDGKFSQTKYKVISVEGAGARAKCN